MSDEDKKFPFSIKIDKKDIKLKLKKNIKELADKFSWQNFFTRVLSKKRFWALLLLIILGSGIFLFQLYNSILDSNSAYKDKVILEDNIPAKINQTITDQKEKNNSEINDKSQVVNQSDVANEMNLGNKGEAPIKNDAVTRQASYKLEFKLPVQDGKLIREYGWSKHPVLEDWRFHQGLDFKVSQSTPIRAVAAGKVEEVREDDYLGLVMVLSHKNGYLSLYGHAQKFYLKKGQDVKAGQSIGEVGDSGLVMKSTLHFEVWKDEQAVDPSEYLNL
jgi:murein DD-endopeptidase MepM/ murein hydrolase activator NlpD